MKRDSLFEKLEIILAVEAMVLLLAMANQQPASAKQPTRAIPAPVNIRQPYTKMC
jgi:hypothetical protein